VRVFVDACVLIATFLKPDGTSGEFKKEALHRKAFTMVVSKEVLQESVRAIGARRGKSALRVFYQELDSDQVEFLTEDLPPESLRRWVALVPPRDCHVLAGAVFSQADALVSLDEDHILTRIVRQRFSVLVFTPLEFLVWFSKHSSRS